MYSRFVMATLISVGLFAAGPSLALAKDEQGTVAARTHEEHAQASRESAQNHCEHCKQAAKNLDDVMAALDKTKQSNDLAEIRTAVEQAQRPLAQIKEHMATCQMKMSKAEGICSTCHVKFDRDGRCPKCGMKM